MTACMGYLRVYETPTEDVYPHYPVLVPNTPYLRGRSRLHLEVGEGFLG